MTLETQVVPRPRKDLDAATVRRIERLRDRATASQDELEQAVVDAYLGGAGLRTIQERLGYAQTTVLRWVAERRVLGEDAR